MNIDTAKGYENREQAYIGTVMFFDISRSMNTGSFVSLVKKERT